MLSRPLAHRPLHRTILAVLVLVLPHALVAATASGPGSAGDAALARLQLSVDRVDWELNPGVDRGEGLMLSISDPVGRVRAMQVKPGEVPFLALVDGTGHPLPDGTYTWELRGLSSPGAKDESSAMAAPGGGLVQAGTFALVSGRPVPFGLQEPPEARGGREGASLPTKDQTVPDDLIVDGKGCIGLGCAAGEGFFSEALRLK